MLAISSYLTSTTRADHRDVIVITLHPCKSLRRRVLVGKEGVGVGCWFLDASDQYLLEMCGTKSGLSVYPPGIREFQCDPDNGRDRV